MCLLDLAEPPHSQTRETPSSNPEHLYARSYERHRNGAEAFTKDFVKMRDQDLNITLVAVSSVSFLGPRVLTRGQAGLLSTVTSAFILYIQPQLRADPNEESAALLRVLIYKTDNTAFGGDVPEVPRWTGPPNTTVVALLLLYISLAGTLGATLFAILAKQLLNLYASVGTSGSNLTGNRTRERRLRWFAVGLHATVFYLSFTLQIALFFLGCALTVYIWNVSRLIASFALLTTVIAISFASYLLLFGLADVGYSHYLRSREDDVNATSSENKVARIVRYFRPCS